MDSDTTITAVGAVMAVLSIASVSLRFYARRLKRARYKWDDWLALLALLGLIVAEVMVICANVANPPGAEASSDTTGPDKYTAADVQYTKISYFATVVYFTITSATKMSILLLYARLFTVDPFRLQIFCLCGAVGCFWLGCTLADLLFCIPIRYAWEMGDEYPLYCFNYNIFWLASGLVEAALDILILLLPISVIVGLHLSLKKKIAVTSIFAVGALVIVSGLLKAGYGYVPGSRQPSFSRTDIWTIVHCGTGIMCACLPVCWPVFVRLGSFGDWSCLRQTSAARDHQALSSTGSRRPIAKRVQQLEVIPMTKVVERSNAQSEGAAWPHNIGSRN